MDRSTRPKTVDIREPEQAVVAGVPAAAAQVTASVKAVTPPIVIPAKPALPVQLAANTGEKTSLLDESVQRPENAADDNSIMALNDFYVQISSQPSKGAAQHSAEEARKRFGSVIENNSIVIVPAVIPDRGTYYRVRNCGLCITQIATQTSPPML